MARNSASVLIASFQENYEQLFRFLTRKLGGDHERAADVVQDTYVRLADAHDQGDVIDNPRAYIYRVAGNLAIDGIRREKRITAHHDMDEDTDAIHDPKPGPENIVLDREQILLLDKALEKLPEKPRMALLMFRVDGLLAYQTAWSRNISCAPCNIAVTSFCARAKNNGKNHCRFAHAQTS